MTQSQTSTFMNSSFPFGGTSKGLSIHEREREAARIERERQLQNVEAVSLPTPLFPQPKKVQPCREDRLQHNIQATLGDFNVLAPSMSHQKQYSLLGITNKVPQTPVNATNKVFNFENPLQVKSEETKEQNSLKSQKLKTQNRTKGTEAKNKKQTESVPHMKETPLIRKLFSEDSNTKINSTIKKEPTIGEGSSSKPDLQVQANGIEEGQKPSIKKEAKDVTNKHKPPKLSIQARSPDMAVSESIQASSVERILEEMTQPGPPPLTAIHTPHKNNAQFAFPHRGSSIQHDSSLASNPPAKKEEETNGLLTDDLLLTDDEEEGNDRSSSDESDSDSSDSDSDSDSDSSGSDNSPLNSPVRSELNRPVKNGQLNNSDVTSKELLPSATHAATTSSPTLNGVGGDQGVRGDQAAPAPHTSSNNSPLNSVITNDITLLNDLPFELPVLSNNLFDDSVLGITGDGSNGFTDILSTDLDGSQVLPHQDVTSNSKLLEIQSPKVKHKEIAENGIVENSNISKKHTDKGKKHSTEMDSKTPKQSKEKTEKQTSKSTVKRKNDCVKLKSNTSNSISKNSNHSTKEDSKTKKNGKGNEMKNGKSKKSSKLTPAKAATSDGENEEIDVVTISSDGPFSNKSDTGISKEDLIKSTKPVNGFKESTNGNKGALSPLPSNEITLDCDYKPDALIVKIPLALLKRIPHLKGQDSVVISTRIENGKSNGLDSKALSSPPRKAAKHNLSVECSEAKKAKYDQLVNGESKNGRRHSTSGNYSDESRRKRSPSRESDRHQSKRKRHDSESKKESERGRERSSERELGNGKMNGWDRMKDCKTPQEHSEANCHCGGQKEIDKRDSWISKAYDPEPRVPLGPDHYLREAKRVKHHADAIKDHTLKAYKYFKSVLNFVNCGKALEQNNETESKSAYQMYTETIQMLKYSMRLAGSRTQEKKIDKRFTGLCLRLESLLYMRLFKLRKDSMLKASKTLIESYKGQAKNSQAPSPYNASNPKTTGTPSPMSPTPSPSGSIGSVGSVSSAGSNETMTTPSRTNKMSSNCMTLPVNISIPQKIHTMTLQHFGFTNHMLYGYDLWEQSQLIFNEHREFFMDLDRTCGPLTLQSSIVDVVEYMEQAHQRLQKT